MTKREKKPIVLVVDDNSQNLKLLTNTLRNAGYRVSVAQDGESALSRVQHTCPDLILLDIMMPKMDGIETCQRLRSNANIGNIPIIFITALADTETKLKAFRAGGVDFITKPFIEEEVLARVNVHIQLDKTLKEMEKLAVTDTLTGAFNRRSAYKILAQQIEIAKREKQGFIVCYIDIDGLKKVNDTHGHLVGDSLIKTVARFIKTNIRASDYLFRMGGDEFLVVFPKIKLQNFHNLVKRIKRKLSQEKILDIPIDFSVGFCEFCGDENVSCEALINRADAKMYREKLTKKCNNNNITCLPNNKQGNFSARANL